MKQGHKGTGGGANNREGELLLTYGAVAGGGGGTGDGRSRGGGGGSRGSNPQYNRTGGQGHPGRPWEHYGKEEQYERILQLRAKLSTQDGELRSLRQRLMKSEREKFRAERGVEKTIGRATHVMVEAMQSGGAGGVVAGGAGAGGGGSSTRDVPVGISKNISKNFANEQRMMSRLRNQVRQMTREIGSRDKTILDLKRTIHYARTTELQVELEEYREEVMHLRSAMSTMLRQSNPSPEK
jgi:hypothetical protein